MASSPSRRPVARPAARPRSDPEDVVKAPGIAAFLRRHPKFGQRAALGAIVSGVALFVVACVTTPLAAANVAAPEPSTSADLPFAPLVTASSPEMAAPAVEQALQRGPKHAKMQAPASHGVISGLAANGIPQVALNAYRVAAARMTHVDPGCGIDWALLAGIGRVESDHGRFAGAVLHADGVSTPRIIGIPLDGVGTTLIRDTDGGRLDGDTVYDRAVGPMQFIPSTWGIYGTDATGDGTADPFNINDAALTAARYLCAAGGDLRTRDGQVRAVLAYNHSDEYLAQVLALADAYRRGIPVTGVPVGITSGPLPTITDTGYIPPANPAAPPAGNGGTSKSGSGTTPGGSTSSKATKPGGTTSSSGAANTYTSRPSSAPAPTTAGTSTASLSPTSSPSPTNTCTPLDHLLGKC